MKTDHPKSRPGCFPAVQKEDPSLFTFTVRGISSVVLFLRHFHQESFFSLSVFTFSLTSAPVAVLRIRSILDKVLDWRPRQKPDPAKWLDITVLHPKSTKNCIFLLNILTRLL
jgi:hypothetical protein